MKLMSGTRMTKLVIFDLDGVLIDSKDYHYEAMQHIQQNHTFINRTNALIEIFNNEI
jgi:beta-phosphoglucomutase-like phosphatase (HAD superfamily)